MKRTKPPKKELAKRVQIGTHIDAELYRRAKAQAAIEGRKIGEVIDDAISEYLDTHKE